MQINHIQVNLQQEMNVLKTNFCFCDFFFFSFPKGTLRIIVKI